MAVVALKLFGGRRYAKLLAATMQHTPKVYGIDPSELVAFCSDSGYQCRLEPCGSLLLPPDYNVGITDWERLCSLRWGPRPLSALWVAGCTCCGIGSSKG
jgi:hypothetical protein